MVPSMFTSEPRPRTAAGARPGWLVVVLTLVVALAALMPGAAAAQDGRGDREMAHDDIYVLELPNGNELRFVELKDPAGRDVALGIVETLMPETASYLDIRELRSADPAEVAWALSPPGSDLPGSLYEDYGRPELGNQGWGLASDILLKRININCLLPSTFGESFPSFTHHKVLSFDDGVYTNPSAWHWDLTSADGDPFDGLSTTRAVYGVPAYHAKVTRCGVADTQYPGGPQVRFDFGKVNVRYTPGDLPKYGSSVSVTWLPYPAYAGLDIELTVGSTWPGDAFHIGYGWPSWNEFSADPSE